VSAAMTPNCMQNPLLVSAFASRDPMTRLKGWQGFHAALVALDHHSRTELLAMAEMELAHARKDIQLQNASISRGPTSEHDN
jgi:hypothetical protein